MLDVAKDVKMEKWIWITLIRTHVSMMKLKMLPKRTIPESRGSNFSYLLPSSHGKHVNSNAICKGFDKIFTMRRQSPKIVHRHFWSNHYTGNCPWGSSFLLSASWTLRCPPPWKPARSVMAGYSCLLHECLPFFLGFFRILWRYSRRIFVPNITVSRIDIEAYQNSDSYNTIFRRGKKCKAIGL